MKKIKVLHLTSTRYGIGGVERLLLDMSRKYDLSGFEIAYCNLFCDADGEGAFPKALRERGLTSFSIGGNEWVGLPKVIFELRKLLSREQFDILHLHMLQATVIGSIAAALRGGAKTVLTKHYTDELSRHSAPIKSADLYFTKRADRVVAISEYVKNDMVRLGVDGKKIVNVHNGIDLSSFDDRTAEKVGLRNLSSVITIGSVGSLTERKGHGYLIEAMPLVLEKFPQTHLLLVGEGPEEALLTKLINDLGLENNVTMLGFSENVAPILSALDLYVHPSVHEPFGIALLEAMAARKCVIATDVEGVPEIVVPGETGFLTQAGDPAALAGSILKALENREAAAIMGQKGRRRVEEFFTIDRTVERYQDIYRSVMSA